MDAIDTLLQSPWISVLLLVVLAVEAGLLLVVWAVRRCGLPPLQVLSFLGAGAGFALALGAVLAQLPPVYTGGFLLIAFLFHAADLKLRWQS